LRNVGKQLPVDMTRCPNGLKSYTTCFLLVITCPYVCDSLVVAGQPK